MGWRAAGEQGGGGKARDGGKGGGTLVDGGNGISSSSERSIQSISTPFGTPQLINYH